MEDSLKDTLIRLMGSANLDEKLVRLHQYLTKELMKRGLLEALGSAVGAEVGAPALAGAGPGAGQIGPGGPPMLQMPAGPEAFAPPQVGGEQLTGTGEQVIIPGVGYVQPHPNQIAPSGYPVNEGILRTINDQFFELETGQQIDPDDSDDSFFTGWFDDSELALDASGYMRPVGGGVAADMFE